MTEIIRYFDLFAGIGGFRCAAEQIKNDRFRFEHVAYCEIDRQAQRFYDEVNQLKSVQRIDDARRIKTAKILDGVQVVDFDMLFAGFPCQSFSNVGYRKGFDDERGQLFFYILDILDYYRPKYFVLENVQKLSTIKRGNLLEEMKAALREIGLGYHLHTWDLLASDYGLPQKRNRLFFCGIRKDVSEVKHLEEPPTIDLKTATYPTAWHLLEKGEVDKRHYIPQKTRQTVLYKNPIWQGDVNIDNAIARPLTASMSKWHRANQDNYFSEAYIKSGNPYERPKVNLEAERIRRITPLEGFRLQGFPDFYTDIAEKLKLSYSTQYKLIGNALPVDLAKAVIAHLLDNYLGD